MNENNRTQRDFIQNVLIALLSVSAVLLFTQTQLFTLGRDNASGYLDFFSGDSSQSAVSPSTRDVPLSAPVRVAVIGSYGRYGSVTASTTDEAFEPLRALLEEALVSAENFAACGESSFRSALQGTSVYYDFLAALPLPVLADLVWTSSDQGTLRARRVVLSAENNAVTLYLWDDSEQFLRCATAVAPEDLERIAVQYELGGAHFAFETSEETYHALDPYSLLPDTEPSLPILSAATALPHTDALLSVLQFNPNTQNRYPEPGGAEVIVESGRTLRIHTDGTVSYRSGGSDLLSIDAAGNAPTLLEAATGTGTLLNSLLSLYSEITAVYLEDIQRLGDTTILRFGYQVNGVPVRFSDGSHAAEAVLSGAAVSSLSLRIRQYTVTETTSMLLPLRQAAAIAAAQGAADLSVGYADNGGDTLKAQWLSD